MAIMMTSRRVTQHGLSLIELLIALSLTALIAAVSYPSLSVIVKSWNSIGFDVTPNDDFATQRFVRHQVQQAALIFEKESSTRENLLVFDGSETKFSFASPMLGFSSQAALYLASIEIEETARSQDLIFKYRVYSDQNNEELTAFERLVLFEDITQASIDYYSADKKAWVSEWHDKKILPTLLRLKFDVGLASSKEWVIDLKMAPVKRMLTRL